MKCPFCKQDFSDNTAEFHIPWCKEQKAGKKAVNAGENKNPDDIQKNKKNSGDNVTTAGASKNEEDSTPSGDPEAK